MVEGKAQAAHWWFDGVFGIQCSTNPGALFGIGKGYSFVFAIVSLVALAGILIWLFWFKQAVDRLINFSLGLITGGIIGNFYDRVGLGYKPEYPEEIRDNVRDWILFRWEGGPKLFDPWPNFNIADSLLVVGAALLFFHSIFYGDPNDTAESAESGGSNRRDVGCVAAATEKRHFLAQQAGRPAENQRHALAIQKTDFRPGSRIGRGLCRSSRCLVAGKVTIRSRPMNRTCR